MSFVKREEVIKLLTEKIVVKISKEMKFEISEIMRENNVSMDEVVETQLRAGFRNYSEYKKDMASFKNMILSSLGGILNTNKN